MHAIKTWLAAVVCGALLSTAIAQPAPRPVAAVFQDAQIQRAPAFPRQAARMVETAGYEVRFIDAGTLTNREALTPARWALLVLPGGRTLPAAAIGPIRHFLEAGGNLLALGAPLWETPLYAIQGRWLSPADYERELSEIRPARVLFDFKEERLDRWTRNHYRPAAEFLREATRAEQKPALHVRTVTASGWETLSAPPSPQGFPPGHTLTCFWAKGGPRTRVLSLEWAEQDGSRWIAVVELEPEWRHYALTPARFRPWTPPPGRGGPGDFLHADRAVRFTVGLAESHNADMHGTNEYWIAEIGTAPNPFGQFEPPSQPEVPHLEALSPGYLFHPIALPVELSAPGSLADSPGGRPPARFKLPARFAGALRGLHPRPGGAGFDQGRPWRWEPLLEARAGDGDYRGAVAAMVVHAAERTAAVFTPEEPEFYNGDEVRQVVQDAAVRIRRGLFLLEGGAEFFTLFANQPVRLGARVMTREPFRQQTVTVRITATPAAGGPAAFSFSAPLTTTPRPVQAVETNWLPGPWPPGGYQVAVTLLEGNTPRDRLVHELHAWLPKAERHYIEARDGGFWLEGRPWKAHGVNYMPSSGIGVDGDYFEHWVGRGAYDPQVIERDLRRIKAMNLNALSVFIHHRSLGAQHLLDFLRRSEELGLRVNLSLRPGTPLDFRWSEMKALIEHYRLAQSDTVFACDLAWEPSHYDQAYQERHYTQPWQQWVRKRYGDEATAARAWHLETIPQADRERAGYQAPSIPPMSWLGQDGPWRQLAADYRLFLDELLGPAYAEARRLVRTIDPHHPVSFRMQLAGDPTHNGPPLPYDFYGLAGAVDIWEPEAYGRIGDWEQVKPGEFTAAYARLCDPSKPVLWAEMGYTVWDLRTMAPSPARLEFTAQFYRDFYRMMTESGADGVFFWWYPGGYRLNERSDFGIINPDGTDRAITRVIREQGPAFLAAPKPPAPNRWISVDRSRDARGLAGIYDRSKAEYWQAVAAGQRPGLKWAKKPGD